MMNDCLHNWNYGDNGRWCVCGTFESGEWINLFQPEEPKKLGSMQCPTCKRFAKIIRIGNDSNPEHYYESWYAVVDCKKCGIGENT